MFSFILWVLFLPFRILFGIFNLFTSTPSTESVIYVNDQQSSDGRRRGTCPACKEMMLVGATKCPFCGTDGITWPVTLVAPVPLERHRRDSDQVVADWFRNRFSKNGRKRRADAKALAVKLKANAKILAAKLKADEELRSAKREENGLRYQNELEENAKLLRSKGFPHVGKEGPRVLNEQEKDIIESSSKESDDYVCVCGVSRSKVHFFIACKKCKRIADEERHQEKLKRNNS